jgi:hypothetical protein
VANEKAGAFSDANGTFRVSDGEFPSTSMVSYEGYRLQEVVVHNHRESVIILLREDLGLLNEIVVVGYVT